MTRKPNLLITSVAGAALAFAVLAGPAVAQEATPAWQATIQALNLDPAAIGAGDFTAATVTADDPFGDIDVDLTTLTDENAVGTFLATLTPDQLTELIQRCNVVSANAATYQANAVSFCGTVATAVGGGADAGAATTPATPVTPAPAP